MNKMFHRKKLILIIVIFIVVLSTMLFACSNYKTNGHDYTLIQIDLSDRADFVVDSKYDYLYQNIVIDDNSNYMAHPDSILVNNKIITMYVNGHGKGEILTKESIDGGISYSNRLDTTPQSWKKSEETPTLFRLDFKDKSTKYIMVSANPKWPGYISGDGFNVSISSDDCKTWSEFKKFYGKKDKIKHVNPIVAMSSLVHLKENGEFVDKWMGIFHDNKFKNYKTILTFDENGEMNWSKPQEYFKGENGNYFKLAKSTQMCEVMMIRSDMGYGDELCLITRSNTKKCNSFISFSKDEGETWSEPKEIFADLNGERHKALYTKDGRLVITFRSIERDPNKIKKYSQKKWFSEGWIMWVGTYEDLANYYMGDNNSKGNYRVKIAHTYLKGQKDVNVVANADTGYAGNVVLDDGTIITTSYGCFDSNQVVGKEYKTFIVSKRIKLEDLDEILNLYKANEI